MDEFKRQLLGFCAGINFITEDVIKNMRWYFQVDDANVIFCQITAGYPGRVSNIYPDREMAHITAEGANAGNKLSHD